MSAFARGLQMGQQAWDTAENNRVRNEELSMRKAKEARDAETHQLQTDALRREASTQNELRGLRTNMADFLTGTDRKASNANLDADFEQAYQATGLGLEAPAMAGGSNMANEQALTVRRPVDMSSPEFQGGLAGLRSQYALASGNMADLDAVTSAERNRITSAQDAEWAQSVISNPNGEQAVRARSFINDSSKSLSIDPPDPKTGMSTLRIIRGDRTKPVELSPADLAKIAVGVRRLQRGDVGGLDVISGVNKELAAAAAAEFEMDVGLASRNNDTAYRAAGLANDRARLGLQERAGRNLQRFQNDKGEVVLVDVAGLPRDKDGTVAIPQGLKPINARPEFSFADVTARAKALVESGAVDPDNSSVPLSLNKALQIVQQEASTGQPYMSLADRIAAALADQAEGGAPEASEPTNRPSQRGLLTDQRGQTQLLEPFSRLNDWRRRLVDETNDNMRASGL